jgi:hypothetical protein
LPCIFCKTDVNLTEEHVFPAFTGSKLVVPAGSCKACNEKCSRFEGGLANETKTARHIFEIPNRYGEIPSAKVTIEVEGYEIPAKRLPDGEIRRRDFVTETKSEIGKKGKQAFFVSEAAARKFVENSRKRGQKTTELPIPKDLVIKPVSAQNIGFAFGADARRTAAKIALTAVAYEYGTDSACAEHFDSIRQKLFVPIEALTFAYLPTRISLKRSCVVRTSTR